LIIIEKLGCIWKGVGKAKISFLKVHFRDHKLSLKPPVYQYGVEQILFRMGFRKKKKR
jgi:hypothetical protein